MLNFIPDAHIGGKKIQAKYFIYFLLAILLSIFQVAFTDFISIGGLAPDFLIILVVWISLREGQHFGTISGFVIGILFDIISMDVIGTNAFAKVIAGFTAGFFVKENTINKLFGTFSFIGIVFLSATFHNLAYYFFYIKPTELSLFNFFLRYGIASTLYTTVFSVIVVLIKFRRN
jgi:rod shape-determining protein MreD